MQQNTPEVENKEETAGIDNLSINNIIECNWITKPSEKAEIFILDERKKNLDKTICYQQES